MPRPRRGVTPQYRLAPARVLRDEFAREGLTARVTIGVGGFGVELVYDGDGPLPESGVLDGVPVRAVRR